jgi:hypothetical protein
VELAELIERSRPMEPIALSVEGITFVQLEPPGLHDRHLRDEMKLEQSSGMHLYCGGRITFPRIAENYRAAVCNGGLSCNLHIPLPNSVSTLGGLRQRGNQLRSSINDGE